VRNVIHLFNAKRLAFDGRWPSSLISDDDVAVIVAAARIRPEQPFTHWSLRRLVGYLADQDWPVRIGRERLPTVALQR
jgi:hypothetical protein